MHKGNIFGHSEVSKAGKGLSGYGAKGKKCKACGMRMGSNPYCAKCSLA